MTPTEVLKQISKMPVSEKRQVLVELTEQLEHPEPTGLVAEEKKFLNALRQKGLVTEIPHRLPEDGLRRRFKRIEIKGEPISETIVEERG